ncbi:disease resistance protein RPM1-like [Phoenix dactylifera]|uniref:Disease resistance protein RPM1-like n=1 Tax=Phoenix dactylifera TaxID=42345 RepID=A0A8B9B0K6_PHODC|nr:disease resistance protein RPM1-like [Phoenix dactylifera]
MAEEVVGAVVEKLSTAAINELGALLGVRDDMQYIKYQLNIMKAYLRRAEERQDANSVARTWAKQVQELAYDAEDCIDEFMFHLSQPTAPGLAGALQRCMRFLRTLKARHRIANQIQDIKSGVERATQMRLTYNISETTQGVATIPAPLDPRLPALFVKEAELVGIDKPKETLIQWLTTENEPQLSVTAVVGMGGLGKTTLVRKVYESLKLGQLFQFCAWITVSKFHIKDLLRDMIHELQNIPGQETDPLTPVQLIEKLKDHLEDKRYLIVFDDIWDTNVWENITPALADSENGSRVVVTTRKETVANTCRSTFHGGHVYNHQPLSHEQSWDLFSNRVFKNSKEGCPLDLEELSDAILKKCGGLPLAIVTIAGLLASKPNKTREEWRRVHDGLRFELETNPDLERVKQILNLSYNDLPYDLRSCFLYLSKYPEDYEIKRRHVVELWVAEGFARGIHDISAEEVAERYFDEFINRSMIQPSKVSWDGKVKSCQVHDVMLEVIVSKSREQNLVSLLGERGTASLTSEQKIRRLSAHTWSHLEGTDLSHVRSITVFAYFGFPLVPDRLRLLRILDLDKIWLHGGHLEWIGTLVSLRYVSIYLLQRHALPESWGNLHELETLNVRPRVQLTSITGLQRLRQLRGSPLHLPNGGIANLKALQALGDVVCSAGRGQMIEELGELTQLRHLSLMVVAPVKASHISSAEMQRLSASLAKLNSCLRSLKIKVTDLLDQFPCLESVSPPPLQLQKLALSGPLKKLPSWVASLKDVTEIRLHGTELEDGDIKDLQNLPNLVNLELRYNSHAGRDLCFAGEGFPSLRILVLGGPKSMKSLTFEQGAMPNLRRLAMRFNGGLWSGLSHNVLVYGLEHVPGLKEIACRDPRDSEDRLLPLETHHRHPPYFVLPL